MRCVKPRETGFRLISRVFPAPLAQRPGYGNKVLPSFKIKLLERIGKEAHAIFQGCDTIDATGLRCVRSRVVRLECDVLKEPENGHPQKLGNVAQYPGRRLLSTNLVGVVGMRIDA